jgi:predicted nucleotidyltransferase
MVLNRRQIDTLVTRLQHDVQPESVWLFGSQATGRARDTESDVDLCIIIKDELNPYHFAVQAYQSLQDMPFPKDIIVRQKSRFEKRASWPSSIEHEIKEEGRLLYSA